MAGLGIIATGAAWLNLRNAKKNLNVLMEQRDGLMAAISAYNNSKYDAYIDTIDIKPTEKPDGVMVSTLLRVANLVGKVMYARTSVIFTNTSDQTYYLHYISAECKLYDEILQMYDISNLSAEKLSQYVDKLYELKPGEVLEVQLPKGITGISDMGKLRGDICSAAGKKLITSCPKLNIEGIEKADILVRWSVKENTKDTEVHEWIVQGKPGILRYCGEAGLG